MNTRPSSSNVTGLRRASSPSGSPSASGMPSRIASHVSARYIAPVSRYRKPSRSASLRATVLLPAPAGPSIATIIAFSSLRRSGGFLAWDEKARRSVDLHRKVLASQTCPVVARVGRRSKKPGKDTATLSAPSIWTPSREIEACNGPEHRDPVVAVRQHACRRADASARRRRRSRPRGPSRGRRSRAARRRAPRCGRSPCAAARAAPYTQLSPRAHAASSPKSGSSSTRPGTSGEVIFVAVSCSA